MDNQKRFPRSEEQYDKMRPMQTEPLVAPPPSRRHAHSSAWRRSDIWFLLAVLLLGFLTLEVFPGSGTTLTRQKRAAPPTAASSSSVKTRTVQTSPALTEVTAPQFREYALPQSNSQIMRMAVDHEGRVWFGEMGRNALAVFDPRTQTFQQMTPPDGHYGIMGIQVASDDTIWFAEQYANYIGHYLPTTDTFQIYHLPTLTIPNSSSPGNMLTLPSAPNDLAIDMHGYIWFTEQNAGSIGELDPQTGHLTQYPLTGTSQAEQLTLYGITVDSHGLVWFTEVGTNHLGRLDPTTGKITYFTQPDTTQALMEIASGKNGMIWATSFSANALLRLDPRTGKFTTYHASPTTSGAGGLYGLVVSSSGAVWVTVLAENMLARLDVTTGHFTFYPIPTPNSEPLALATAAHQTLWFSEIDKLGMLRL